MIMFPDKSSSTLSSRTTPAFPNMTLPSLFSRLKVMPADRTKHLANNTLTPVAGVRMRKGVSPVCLPGPDTRLPAGSTVLVAGWGATSEGGLEADRLQEVTVEVTGQERCRAVYKELVGAEIGEDILCAGLEEGGKDACQGDSGGPLVSGQGGTFQLVGVVSSGLGCARRNVPGLYAGVASHMDWVEEVRGAVEQ